MSVMVLQEFDVAIIFPLEEEFQKGTEFFENIEDVDDEKLVIFSAIIPDTSIKIALVKQFDMGKGACRDTLEHMLRKWKFRIIISAGIGGGISKDFKIGDVCYSRNIFDVTDNGKIDGAAVEGQSESLILSTNPYKISASVTPSLGRFKISPSSKAAYIEWSKEAGDRGRSLVPGEFPGRNGPEVIQNPKAQEGDIVCGLVSASESYNKKLKSIDRRMAVLDTESGALGAVCDQHGVPGVVFRGVSDYAGEDKTEFENKTDNKARDIAIHNVMSFLMCLFRSEVFKERLYKLPFGGHEGIVAPLISGQNSIVDELSNCVSELSAEYNAKIRDLTPQIEFTDSTYRLPTPRIQFEREDVNKQSLERVCELRDLLKRQDLLAIETPIDYPDKSLPYIFASDILCINDDEKSYVPYVVDVADVTPPKGSIETKIPEKVRAAMKKDDAQGVIIVENFPQDFTTRAKHVLAIIEHINYAKVVIIKKGKFDLGVSNRLREMGAKITSLSDISFQEITHFIKNNFDLDNAQAEYIATRLGEIFDEFNMCSHPSYYAGIPKDALRSLMDAHKKAEFMEIATAGYLSSLVATDNQDVNLGRKAREQFLSLLAKETHLDRRVITEESIVSLADKFSKDFDFAIDKIKFVHAFIDKGILHKVGGEIKFSYPFMESYLLAKILQQDSERAKKYFNLDSDLFDIDTFLIYAELGIDDSIVDMLISKLDITIKSLDTLVQNRTDNSKLLAQLLEHNLFAKIAEGSNIDKKLEALEKDIVKDRDLSKEKQSVIDIQKSIKQTADKKTRNILYLPKESDKSEIFSYSSDILRIGQLALAAGAERLRATHKRQIIPMLSEIGEKIFNIIATNVLSIDFSRLKKEMKSELCNNEQVRNIIIDSGNKVSIEEFIEHVVDLQEVVLRVAPFLDAVNGMCDNARSNVLVQSIKNSTLGTDFQKLVVNFWICNLNVNIGKPMLENSIKKLPKNKSLRIVIAMLIMSRVYWNQHNREERTSFINIAKTALRAAKISMDPEKMGAIIS